MHNLHYVVVSADDPKSACQIVESEIGNWGNENNWRIICGCISEDNEVYNAEEGRYMPDKDETIESINKSIDEFISSTSHYNELAVDKLKTESDLTKWSKSELWSLERLAKDMYEKKDIVIPFNILDKFYPEIYSWQFDEFGVTKLGDDMGSKKYVVFVDMHS